MSFFFFSFFLSFTLISNLHSPFHLQSMTLTHTPLNTTDPRLYVENFLKMGNKGHVQDRVQDFTLSQLPLFVKILQNFYNQQALFSSKDLASTNAANFHPASDLTATSLEFYRSPPLQYSYRIVPLSDFPQTVLSNSGDGNALQSALCNMVATCSY